MIRRTLALALAAALVPASAGAADLLQTYEMARNGDPTLAIAESNSLYTKEGQVQARAELLPQLSGDARLSRSRTEIEGIAGTRESTSRSYGLSASQTLFNWGQFSSLRAQRSLSAAADHTLDAANDDLVVRTAAAYFDVLVAIESLAAAETNEAAGKRQFDYADKRLEVGLAPITDVHEARAQYDDARANTILVRNALQYEPSRQFDAVCVTGAVADLPARFLSWLRPGGRLFVVRGQAPVMEAVRLGGSEGVNAGAAESLFETELDYLQGAKPVPQFSF